MRMRKTRCVPLAVACLLAAGGAVRPAWGYVEAAYTLGRLINESSNVLLVRVESVDRQKNLIIYSKVRDVKGTFKDGPINHNIGQRGFHPREWQTIMAWAEMGRIALMFTNGGASEMCLDKYWYQATGGDWWSMTHAEPYLLRSFAGKPEKLAGLVTRMLAGEEIITPCMVDGDKNALQLRTARMQRMKASLQVSDYNPTRDFVGWGVEEFRAIGDMPGFTHQAPLACVGPGAGGVAPADLDADGKPDFCLYGAGGVVLLQNGGGSFNEVTLPLRGGARAAAWADYDSDGRADLLLATPTGPVLLRNEGKRFVDVTDALPRRGYSHPTAAAWLDYDGDKRQDILLADGFRGLRLYRNDPPKTPPSPAGAKPGVWYYAGPFDNDDRKGFEKAFPPEKEIDLSKEYPGKRGAKVVWKEGKFKDGEVSRLDLFQPPQLNRRAIVYLYRELDFGRDIDLPVSLGSDDTLTVWLNGEQVLAQNTRRECRPDQAKLTLELKPGPNALLLKVCNHDGVIGFYFSAQQRVPYATQVFQDVSDAVGLGSGGIAGALKGHDLAIADVNGDKRPDVLFTAGTGVLALNTPKGFVQATDCGIAYEAGPIAPAFGDFDGDGDVDLFVPQRGRCKLFRNDGAGKFTDVAAASGALAGPIGDATCALWTDFDNRGRLDLLVGCLRGPNRFFRNLGDGKFADAGEDLGLYRRVFNTRGLGVMDVNRDGVPDVVFNNEGQKSAVLLGDRSRLGAVAARSK